MWRVLAAVLCVFSCTCYPAEDNCAHLNGKVGTFVNVEDISRQGQRAV